MKSEGPYKVEQFGARNRNEFVVVGPGWEKVCEIYTRSGAEKAALYSNISYAEGRKAAEKDFKEAIGWADSICLDWNYSKDYKKWKKARGIE